MESAGIPSKLTILDDYFPKLNTGFRISEFNYYMDRYPACEIFSTRYDTDYSKYITVYPQYAGRIKPFTQFDWTYRSFSFFYTVFLQNAYNMYFVFEKANKPFAFELYPGGGFWINDPVIDLQLVKVLQSPLMRKVIVTQKLVYDYITGHGFVPAEKIAYIYGMVTHRQYFGNILPKKQFGADKGTFDICFVANKYMPLGLDKGYHIFVEVCNRLAKAAPNIRFHVVGNFDRNEMDVSQLADRITFYGLRDHNFFPSFYSGMDIIVSPNVPFVLIPGKSFDGFPTGCCIDAGLHNVAVFCTDLLQQNAHFEHRKNIFIISVSPDDITANILEYYHNPGALYAMSALGREKFLEVFSFDRQMSERAAILDHYLFV